MQFQIEQIFTTIQTVLVQSIFLYIETQFNLNARQKLRKFYEQSGWDQYQSNIKR